MFRREAAISLVLLVDANNLGTKPKPTHYSSAIRGRKKVRVITKDLNLRSSTKRGAAAERLPEEEPGRGRHARTPSELPPRGWRDILLRVWANVGRHRVLAIAAGITFYGLLAIFPGIAAALALYGFFADPHSVQGLFDQ